jgi:hypothetical protein
VLALKQDIVLCFVLFKSGRHCLGNTAPGGAKTAPERLSGRRRTRIGVGYFWPAGGNAGGGIALEKAYLERKFGE